MNPVLYGVCKEFRCLAVLAWTLVFWHYTITPRIFMGLCLLVGGAGLYGYSESKMKKLEPPEQVEGGLDSVLVLS